MDGPHAQSKGTEPCKACFSFQEWVKNQTKVKTNNKHEKHVKIENEVSDCPLDKDELGRATWSFIHTMAAYYPESPTEQQKRNMYSFINYFAQFYPCQTCAEHFQNEIRYTPPDTRSNVTLSGWFCEMHNKVNRRLGKPLFDCSKVLERWRDGWADGSCD